MKKYFYVEENNFYGSAKVGSIELQEAQIKRDRGGLVWAVAGVLAVYPVLLYDTYLEADIAATRWLCD